MDAPSPLTKTDLQPSIRMQRARKVFVITLGLNLIVAVSKLACGFWISSLSMMADGFHSLLDSSSNLLGIAAMTVAAKPPDANHPYGHRKSEALGAIAISFFMFLASFEVLSQALERLRGTHAAVDPNIFGYLVMAATFSINLWVSRYEMQKSKELNNSLLAADAQHTATDLWVTGTVVITLIAAQFKLALVDTVGSLVIVLIILKAGYGIITAHLGYLMDEAVVNTDEVSQLVLSVPRVKSCHKIRSRGTKEHTFLDLHVQVDHNLSVEEGHKIAFAVEDKLKQAFGKMTDVLVHIEDHKPQSGLDSGQQAGH